jgi:hypothetical protein
MLARVVSMNLHEAFDHLATIRQRLAESELFRGYRALPVAISGLLAIAAGLVQPILVPEPVRHYPIYVSLWLSVAVLSVLSAGLTMWMRDHFAGPSHTRAITWLAIRQLVPCLVAGAAVTAVIVRCAPEVIWLLPGLWQLFFSQGVFASCRLLPRPVFAVSMFYLAAGIVTLFWFRDEKALSPIAMALPFGLGQLLTAAILYWTLERPKSEE